MALHGVLRAEPRKERLSTTRGTRSQRRIGKHRFPSAVSLAKADDDEGDANSTAAATEILES